MPKHLKLVKPQPPAPRTIDEMLAMGRRCVEILEAPPEDFGLGYSRDEEARQWAACDRLVEAYKYLDEFVSKLMQPDEQEEEAGQQ